MTAKIDNNNKCSYVKCNKQVEGDTTVLVNGFMIDARICWEHWDLYGKEVVHKLTNNNT